MMKAFEESRFSDWNRVDGGWLVDVSFIITSGISRAQLHCTKERREQFS